MVDIYVMNLSKSNRISIFLALIFIYGIIDQFVQKKETQLANLTQPSFGIIVTTTNLTRI